MEKNKKSNKMPVWAIVVIVCAVILSVVPVLGVIYFFATIDEHAFDSEFEVESSGEVRLTEEDITIKSDVRGYYDAKNEQYVIEGYLVNNSGEDYESLDLTYLVYNKDGVLLGNAFAYIDGLKKDETWKFKATYIELDALDVGGFELLSVNAY